MAELAVSATFEQRMKERIKDALGECITDVELKAIVQKSIQELFFNPRTKRIGGGWNEKTEELPCLAHEITMELIKPMINVQIRQWLVDHNKEVQAIVEKTISEGLGVAVMKAMNSQFEFALMDFKRQVENALAIKS